MAVWVGVDVGGTFTDFVAVDDRAGRILTHKTSSTPSNPARAIVDGLAALASAWPNGLPEIAMVAHGTTVGTNALIQRRGGTVAMITTQGFRDVLEIGRQLRPRHFDIYADPPPPVAPRWRRFEIDERLLYDGSVLRAPSDAEIARVVEQVAASDSQAVAVCLLFAFLQPRHEVALGAALRARLPGCHVSLSSEVQPEHREYERFSTTALNAYLQPVLAGYLDFLERELGGMVPQADVAISQSSGGLMSLDRARRFPIRTALSGPAAGVLGAIDVARIAARPGLITFDMGGTSADVAMVRDYEPAISFERQVGGLPVRLPTVDINTIGAGGGSIAWFDRDGLLKVGPMSAGAEPGPAAYGLGGDKPTVTDANLLLNRLDDRGLLDGRMPLDRAAAARVLQPVADRLGAGLARTAHGILEIVVSNMCRAIRTISVERGYDPRELSLLAFGGAGPLHARDVAVGLGMREVIVPPAPGLLCAAGLIVSDLKEDFVRTLHHRVDDAARGPLAETVAALVDAASRWFAAERILPELQAIRLSLDMRHVGQNFELNVPVAAGSVAAAAALPDAARLAEAFFGVHQRAYGHANRDQAVEIVNCRLTASGRRHRTRSIHPPVTATAAARPLGRRPVWFAVDAPVEAAIFRRDALAAGTVLAGPAVIEQLDTTTLLYPGDRLRVDAGGNLLMEIAP
jgi:N-methylhydantoinase A